MIMENSGRSEQSDVRYDAQRLEHRDIPSLYVLKAICAFFVILIHVPTEAHLQALISPVLSCAVPSFYMITVFFLYSGQYKEECSRARKWIKKAFLLSLVFNVLYYVFYTVQGAKYNLTSTVVLSLLFGTAVRTFLWYLTAMWEALAIFIILRRYVPRLIRYVPILFVANPLLGRYLGVIGEDPMRIPNFMLLNAPFVALPCICCGYILSQYREKPLSSHKMFLCFTLSLVLLYVEAILDAKFLPPVSGYSSWIMTFPMAVALFVFFHKSAICWPKWVIHIGKYDSGKHLLFSHVCGGTHSCHTLSPSSSTAIFCIPFDVIIVSNNEENNERITL